MGNSLSNQTPSCCAAGSQDGVLVKVTVVGDEGRLRAREVLYIPTWVEHPSFRIALCWLPSPTGPFPPAPAAPWKPPATAPGVLSVP